MLCLKVSFEAPYSCAHCGIKSVRDGNFHSQISAGNRLYLNVVYQSYGVHCYNFATGVVFVLLAASCFAEPQLSLDEMLSEESSRVYDMDIATRERVHQPNNTRSSFRTIRVFEGEGRGAPPRLRPFEIRPVYRFPAEMPLERQNFIRNELIPAALAIIRSTYMVRGEFVLVDVSATTMIQITFL